MRAKLIALGVIHLPIILLPFLRDRAHRTRSLRDRDETNTPRQLLVDVSIIASHDGKSGIQRVVRALLSELHTHPPTGFVVRPVEAARKRTYRYCGSFGLDDKTLAGQAVAVKVGDSFLGLDFASNVLPSRQYELLNWRRKGVNLWFIVYDLLPVLHDAWFTSRGVRAYRRWLRTLVVHADALFCISSAVEQELHEWLHCHCAAPFRGRSGWFHLGSDLDAGASSGRPLAIKHPDAANWHDKTILMVGTIEPRKGYAFVLDAFERLWRDGLATRLVIVGGVGWSVDSLVARIRTHREAGRRLVWLDKPDDETLLHQYAQADGLLMASEGEGFGLPLVEGARKHLPILAHDLPVFREIGGEHIAYFADSAPQALAVDLIEWLQAIHDGSAPRSEGIRCLSWRESAAQLRSLMEQSADAGQLQRGARNAPFSRDQIIG
ncbi:glycosyltransferase family 1 protein [Paraburkholderia sp. J67]|uniref:glycosyltransferase family 4 protein n=1 Tax=Paraburkholderia sp. J67 TaxID=2805435 RepID=UPI002ABE2DBC|nr:glycosyltransferase family 1 protein [Paraburkholderia sp. J67]